MAAIDPNRIRTVVFDALESFGAERDDISPDTTLESLDVDSLDLVELAQIVEDEFGHRLEAEEFKGVVTVGDALAVVERCVMQAVA